MKVEYFFERYSGPITSPRVERVYARRVTKAKVYLTDKRKLKYIRDSRIVKKVRLEAAKSVSGKSILLKFVRETRTKSPYPSRPKLLCGRSCSPRFAELIKEGTTYSHLQPPREIQQPPKNNRIPS